MVTAANLTYRAEGYSKIHAWKPWLQLEERQKNCMFSQIFVMCD